jgi:hypothetical protein
LPAIVMWDVWGGAAWWGMLMLSGATRCHHVPLCHDVTHAR